MLSTLSCSSEESTELDRQMIGPDGGALSGDGVTVEIPAGALPVETELVLRKDSKDLSVLDFEQMGTAYALEPGDLTLMLP